MITPDDYQTLACLLASAEEYLRFAHESLSDAQSTLEEMNVDGGRRSFVEQSLADAIQDHADQIDSPHPAMIAAVRALQLHVETHYGSVSSFLSANSIIVPEKFADISEAVGYTIPDAYIGDIC